MSRYLALSRTAHALLDLAAPAFCALLWLGTFPPWQTTTLALLTGFAAYTAVYALNDIVDCRDDRQKLCRRELNRGYSMDAGPGRHPLARNELTLKGAAMWAGAWFAAALVGSYLLNPLIVPLLILAGLIEVLYCRLLKVTSMRTLVSGLVKTSGPVAAVLVVDASPQPLPLILLVAWLFFWEVGGQNIPSDWNDTDEDARLGARTVPLALGLDTASLLIMVALVISVSLSAVLDLISPAVLGAPYVVASISIGALLLLAPALRLYRSRAEGLAARLFETASYYPLGMLTLVTALLVA